MGLFTNGVKIGTKHSYDDFGLIMEVYKIASPKPKTITANVMGRDGIIDMTERIFGGVAFENRDITIVFNKSGDRSEWQNFRSTLLNEWHGKKLRITFDNDSAYYWEGRIDCGIETSGKVATITIKASVFPYKMLISNPETKSL